MKIVIYNIISNSGSGGKISDHSVKSTDGFDSQGAMMSFQRFASVIGVIDRERVKDLSSSSYKHVPDTPQHSYSTPFCLTTTMEGLWRDYVEITAHSLFNRT